ncbi:PAS domain S-box protein [Hymenobacter rubripertinctus]|uniref:Sensory/regulatory protein RpfC n=1 Tax=Hymenobacter rubripertinctus TaxID=2029981 RepID=A0A418QXX3_9BACT|nr:PAS domain S-box protein [Hymenobacter rubripertinctus]RIY10023.1 PAS domain S-box protein [Hymenobacter rubripertinctus]
MDSISHRHQRRQLRHVRRAWQQAHTACLDARSQLAELQGRSQAATAQAAALLQTMTTAILAENQDHTVMLVNQRMCELFGLNQPAAYFMGQPVALLLRKARLRVPNRKRIQQQNRQLTEAQVRSSGQLIRLHDGRVLQQDYLPVVQNGVTMLHIWSYEDVTEAQLAQQRVQELSQLAEQSPQPIIRFRPDGQALYHNPAAAPILKNLTKTAAADTRTLLQAEIGRARASGETRTLELSLANEFYLWTIAPLGHDQGANVYLTAIGERRRAEAELLRNQLFTARINDTVPTIVFIFDLVAQRLEYCNRQVELILGYKPEQVLAMGSDMARQLLHPDDFIVAQHRSGQRDKLKEREVMQSEYRFRHHDGSWRWLSIRSTAFTHHQDGQVHQLVGSAADVTERRETDENLRQSRFLVDRITNTIPNLVYIYDVASASNVYCNRFMESMLGYTEAELQQLGSNMISHMTPPAEARRLRQHFGEVARQRDSEVLHLEYMLYHRNGSIRWLRISNTPFARNEQGHVTQIIGSAEDITRWKIADEQRRSANRRLAEQNRLFRQVIDTVPNLIYLKDGQGNYLLANQATAQLYALSNEALLQTPAANLLRRFPDLHRHHMQDEQVLRTQQEIDVEETFDDEQGHLRWFRTIKRPFVLADGTVQVLGVDNDITELKLTQRALEQAKEVAEQNAQTRQTFLTNMSHEIRTPMNGIMGLTELLVKTTLTPEQRQFLHHIQYSAENLLVIINDILDMAQLGAGRVRLEQVPFELQEVLKASCQALLPKATEKGISLRLQLPHAAPNWVSGDPYRLRQVLLNLLNNAIKFTEKGQVLLTYQRVSLPGAVARYQFSVLDTGIGISEGQLHQLFEPFTQASASTAREYGGSGLGLSISRGLVELLGGELTAESKLGQGSTFRFTLELPPAQAVAQAVAAPPPNYQLLRGRRVLLTEDNAVNQLLVQVMLKGWGITVDTASSGAEALALFRQHQYAVVLMDIQMPGMDGVAATQLLRQHPDPARAATPVVALTAHAMPGEEARYLTAGLDAYLSKPFQETELFHVLAKLLNLTPDAPLTPTALPCPALLPPERLYDVEQLRRLSDNDEVFIRRLVAIFVSTTPPVVADLERHLREQNLQKLGAAAHHLKSSIDGLQVTPLRSVLRDLEAAAYAPATADWERLTQGVEQVRHIVDEVIRQLQADFSA